MQRLHLHVFSTSPDAAAAIRQGLQDRRLAKITPDFTAGDIATAAGKYESEASPDLVVIETAEPAAIVLDQLARLAEVCRPETEVILIGAENDVGLYRQLKRRGVHEYLPLPVDPAQLADAVLALRQAPEAAPLGRLIAFLGASGGAGSSTIASNVAWQLAHLYAGEVILADLDLATGTIGLDLNLDSPQSTAQALAQAERLDDQMVERFLARYDDNLALLTSAGDCRGAEDADVPALERLLTTLRRNAGWVVADLPRCWTPYTRHVLDSADEIVITAVPTLASLRNAKAAADILNAGRIADSPVRLALNRMSANPKLEIPAKDFAATFGAAPVARIPYDPAAFGEASTRGHILAERTRSARLADPLRHLAVAVSGRREPERRSRAAWARFLPVSLAWAR